MLHEFSTTKDLYGELLSTDRYSFVYIYSPKCPWCKELMPKFEMLSSFFNGALNFIMIDGRKCRILDKDFNVDTYPYLMLFEAKENLAGFQVEPELTPKNLLKGVYHGAGDVYRMAHYLTQLTGETPALPQPVHENIIELDKLGPHADSDSLDYLDATSGASLVNILSFTSPWMDFYYQELFQSSRPSSLLVQNSQFFDDKLKTFDIDGSQRSTSHLTNLFRVSHFPSLMLLPRNCGGSNSTVVRIEFHQYDSELLKKEIQTVRRLTKLCIDGDQTALSNFVSDFHSISIYPSLEDMQQKVNDAAGKAYEIHEDESDMEYISHAINDL